MTTHTVLSEGRDCLGVTAGNRGEVRAEWLIDRDCEKLGFQVLVGVWTGNCSILVKDGSL